MKLKIPCQIFLRRISQSEIRNSAAAGRFSRSAQNGFVQSV